MKKLTKDFNTINVKKGEVFSIELSSNPSTGYSWDIRLTAGKASLIKKEYVAPRGAVMGGGGVEVCTFRAEEAGTIEVAADYKQFNKTPAAQTLTFKVTVS